MDFKNKIAYITGLGIAFLIIVIFFIGIINNDEDDGSIYLGSKIRRIGAKLWNYNTTNKSWSIFKKEDLNLLSENIVLQVKQPDDNSDDTIYKIISNVENISKEDFVVGENSDEFLVNNTLYTYFPKSFEYFEIVFNGVNFVTKKLSVDDITNATGIENVIKVSELKNSNNIKTIKYNDKNNKFVIINDIGNDFYKYYIVPNDSQSLHIEEFSNQFSVTDNVNIIIQRIEGCSKRYPCYYLNLRK